MPGYDPKFEHTEQEIRSRVKMIKRSLAAYFVPAGKQAAIRQISPGMFQGKPGQSNSQFQGRLIMSDGIKTDSGHNENGVVFLNARV